MRADDHVPAVLKRAEWIWPEEFFWDLHNCYALFRKPFDLPAVPKRAPLFITADQSYHLYLNGKYVCRGPARGFQSHWPYDEVDVAPYLRPGRNLLAVRVHNPGRSTFQYLSQGFAGLLVAAKWGRVEILSDRCWKCIRDPAIHRNTVPSSLQLFDQEWFDARKEPENWRLADFDDSAWIGPTTRLWNAPPWYDLEPRMIPMLAEREIGPQLLVGEAAGACAPDYLEARNLALLRGQENLPHAPAASGRFPIIVPPTGTGRFRSYLIDFGRIVVGSLALTVTGGRGGEMVDALYVETIDEKERTPDFFYPRGCNVSLASRLVCKAGRTEHTFYHPYGFRYLVLTVRDSQAELTVAPHLQWVGYPLERKGKFVTSDEDLARIWEVCAWTEQCCMLDSYVDTPWREQAQWWGDARVQAWNTLHLSGDARLLYRGIHCLANQLTPDGLTYGHAPTMAHNCILPDFTLVWLLTLWDHYWQTGTPAAFKACRESVGKVLGYFAANTDAKTGLVGRDPRYWLYLDWADIFRDGFSAILNLWLLLALEKTAGLYGRIGDKGRARQTARWAKRLRATLRKLVGRDGLVRDGLTWKGKIVPSTSIHAQTLAMMTSLSPSTEAAMLEKVLLPYIRGESRPPAAPSAYWSTYVFTELIKRGYEKEVVAVIRNRWRPMAEFGSTFEHWDPPRGDGSRSHAWSAHPLFHLMNTIGGVRQSAPAWREILFAPTFIGAEGGATVPTPQGAIVSHWRKSGGSYAVELALPPKVRARVRLPGRKEETVAGRTRWAAQVNPP